MHHAQRPAPHLQHAVRRRAGSLRLPRATALSPGCTRPLTRRPTCHPPCSVYHQLEPPSYDLGAISAPPLALFHGGHDRLADAADVATLLRALPPGAVVHSQFEPAYEHIDFTW